MELPDPVLNLSSQLWRICILAPILLLFYNKKFQSQEENLSLPSSRTHVLSVITWYRTEHRRRMNTRMLLYCSFSHVEQPLGSRNPEGHCFISHKVPLRPVNLGVILAGSEPYRQTDLVLGHFNWKKWDYPMIFNILHIYVIYNNNVSIKQRGNLAAGSQAACSWWARAPGLTC